MNTGASSSVGTSSARVQGTVNPNSQATEYRFVYSTNASLSGASTTPWRSSGSGNSVRTETEDLSGLDEDRTYFYRIEARNSFGTAVGETRDFTTRAGTQPLEISVNRLGINELSPGHSITFSISVTSNGSPVSGARVDVLDEATPRTTWVTTNTSGQATYTATLSSGATPGEFYFVDFKASASGYETDYVVRTIRAQAGGTGDIAIHFSGLPSHENPAISVFRADGSLVGACGSSSNPCWFQNLPAGDYRIRVYNKVTATTTYTPSWTSRWVTVQAGEVVSESVSYSP